MSSIHANHAGLGPTATPPKVLTDLTREELNQLLYLETCAVDLSGRVDNRRQNDDDRAINDRWVAEGFIRYGRVCAADINSQGAHWVRLSENAMELAHEARKARAERTWGKRAYLTVEEKSKDVSTP